MRKLTAGTTVQQVNNIRIKLDVVGMYNCIAPDGRELEQFNTLAEAVEFCIKTKDFTRERK